jgi:CheY-like chemotaxis protein
LLANALQNTEKGSVTLSSTCENLNDGTVLIEFSLADTGCGIAAEYRESVFNPFSEKGAKTSGKFGGDGLGLPLCKGLVELLGGDIWIEDNEDNMGTVVKFTIHAELDPADTTFERDVRPQQRPVRAEVRHLPVATDQVSQLHPHRILVVDDDDIHRQIVCLLLKKLGYAADEAADGEGAIAAVMQSSYDLIFMDMRMPVMNGVEATHWIRERFNGDGLRIIALTGDATTDAREECLRAGMDNFVSKPVQIKDLEAILCHTRHDQMSPVEARQAALMH